MQYKRSMKGIFLSPKGNYKGEENEDPSFSIYMKGYDHEDFYQYILLDILDIIELKDLFEQIIEYVDKSPEYVSIEEIKRNNEI